MQFFLSFFRYQMTFHYACHQAVKHVERWGLEKAYTAIFRVSQNDVIRNLEDHVSNDPPPGGRIR